MNLEGGGACVKMSAQRKLHVERLTLFYSTHCEPPRPVMGKGGGDDGGGGGGGGGGSCCCMVILLYI